MGFLGHVPPKKTGSKQPVANFRSKKTDPADYLTYENLQKYFLWHQERTTCRKTRVAPGTIKVYGRGLTIACQVLLKLRPLKEGETTKQRNRRIKAFIGRLKALYLSVSKERSKEGDDTTLPDELDSELKVS